MKISLNWLKKYVDLSGITAADIVSNLTNSGLEVEDVEDKGTEFENIVVGYVKERKKHPNADKLSVCIVTDGTEDYNVVCGAPNVAAGQKVPFAKVGAVVPDGGFKLTKAKIRGEVSMGMICSERELKLSDNHQGIMVLDENLQLGKPLAEALGLNDVLLEVAITPNRPDALSHIGVARDLAAIFNRELHIPEVILNENEGSIHDYAAVEVLNDKDCPRYSAKVVRNVTVKESPTWLKEALTAIGLRPINNIVDVTNYVMHEVGQPLHGFDLDKLSGNKIIVKNANEGEKFTTLDSKERKLSASSLMICDAERSVAIAGVMGGENSEVSSETKNILIESAYFNPSSVRKTSKSLALSTDASYRFERGTDPNITVVAASRAAQLIQEVGGGEILSGVIDVYPVRIAALDIELRFSRVTKVLGYVVPDEEILQILKRLGIQVNSVNADLVQVSVPTFRPDLEREIDLIEEIARIYGYDKIPAVEKISITLAEKKDETSGTDKARHTALSLGLDEIITNSLIPSEYAAMFGNTIDVLNPQSADMSTLRTSLIPGALFTVARNINAGEKSLAIFEIGNVFNRKNEGLNSFEDFTEEEKICFVLTGRADDAEWYGKERNYDFYDLKGFVNSFLRRFYLDSVLNDTYYQNGSSIFEYYLDKTYKNEIIGQGGLLNKSVLKKFDINQDVYYFEFRLEKFFEIEPGIRKFKELLKFPKVVRDCAFIVDNNIAHDEVVQAMSDTKSELLKSIKLFDIFESESLGRDKKSMAFTLEFYDETRTLKDEEVDAVFYKAIESVKKKLNAELRGN